jgi:ribonuclease P protein component
MLLTLKKRPDFLKAARAKRQSTAGFILQARKRDLTETNVASEDIRIGYTCSKKVGNAVARNRAKRRLREIARMGLPKNGLPGWDYVLIGRHEKTATRDFTALQRDLDHALSKLHTPATPKQLVTSQQQATE